MPKLAKRKTLLLNLSENQAGLLALCAGSVNLRAEALDTDGRNRATGMVMRGLLSVRDDGGLILTGYGNAALAAYRAADAAGLLREVL